MHPWVRATKETEFFKLGTATKYFHVKKTRFLRPGIEKQSTVSDNRISKVVQAPGFIRGINPKSKIENPQAPGFIRGVNLKSQISNLKSIDAPYSLYPLRPALLIFVIILMVGNCRCVFFYKKKYRDFSSVSFGRSNRFFKPPYFVQTLTHIKNNF